MGGEMGGNEVKTLNAEQKKMLITFMDFVEAEPDPSIKCLRAANWDIQVAMNSYLRQHPDHPKSRGGSLDLKSLFDDAQMQQLYNGGIDFEQDVHLPPDIGQDAKGRRDSTELEEAPNGARDSDNEENEDETNKKNNEIPPDSNDSESDSEQISYNQDMNKMGARNEYPLKYEYDEYDNKGHRRLDTEQQIVVATQLSQQQSDFDGVLDKYREEIKALKQEIKEKEAENVELKQNMNQIQTDWDRMSGYMTQILQEVQNIENQRKNGQEISTPTPKLHGIFEAIQNTLNRNVEIENNEPPPPKQQDIYQNVANLFGENPPSKPFKKEKKESNNNINRRLSFGAVNELFADKVPSDFLNEMKEIEEKEKHHGNNNNFLSVGNGQNEMHEKRLSYGGVGLLFDSNDHHKEEIDDQEEQNIFDPNPKSPLNVSFKPSYEGIASLFDENNDILTQKHGKKASFGGDIVELFRGDPQKEFFEENEKEEKEEEYSSEDSMDKIRHYNYSEDDDDESEQNEESEHNENEKENKNETEPNRISMHQRFESYQSNLSDPTPINKENEKGKKRHSRGPSFAFKDLFKNDEDSDSSDRAPSVQSAPEEHDYYAITAYYGIEDDDDATGWDSRRSSMFGDYGKIHSRRQSKRVQSQMVDSNIKDMFKVDLTNKLAQHLTTNNDIEPPQTQNNINDIIIKEEEDETQQNIQNIIDNAHDVSDLFEDDKKHKKQDTYSGVKQLFGNGDNSDIDEEDDEYLELQKQ